MPKGYPISKNGFKLWLQCKNCGEYFLAPPKYPNSDICSRSCSIKFQFRDENRRKLMSDVMKKRRADPTSEFNQNNAKAVGDHYRELNKTPEMRRKSSERAIIRNKTTLMKDARSKYMKSNTSKNGFFTSPHQLVLYNYLIPYLGADTIDLEVVLSTKGTKLESEFGQSRIRVDLIHKSSGVIIEVDGYSHNDIIEKDKCRDETLRNLGYHIIRIKNEEIYDNFSRKQAMLQILREVINRESSNIYEQ